MSETKILLCIFHPDLESSRGSRALLDAVMELPNLSYRDMYLEYDGRYVNPATEEIFLTDYDCFVFQFPMYWFGAPTLMAEWMELALAKGFAWPPGEGDALRGKRWLTVMTTAAGADDFLDGADSASIETLCKPFEMSARFCQMEWLPPWTVHDVRPVAEGGLSDEALAAKAQEYKALLESL